MPYTHLSHARLYYEVHGSGAPLILISGLGGDLGFWGGSISRLQDRFRTIAFDNRGIGRSDMPDSPYSMELFADDIAELMDELGIESAHLLGFSMGGCIAQAFALKYPRKVSRLVIAASYAKIGRQAELFLDAVLSVYESGATPKQMYELILPWLFSPAFLGKPENAQLLAFDESDPLQQPLFAFKRQYFAQREFDSRMDLSQIEARTLIVAGERDALVPPRNAQELADLIPGARFTVISDAGHLINFEQPETFHSTITEFLNE